MPPLHVPAWPRVQGLMGRNLGVPAAPAAHHLAARLAHADGWVTCLICVPADLRVTSVGINVTEHSIRRRHLPGKEQCDNRKLQTGVQTQRMSKL